MHIDLSTIEQYNDDRFVIKCVYKGRQSEAVVLYLMPGQEMPTHPHERFEVTLLPQEGLATMTVNGKKEVELKPGFLYYEPSGCTFRIVNTGDRPFQVLITLVLVGETEV